MTWLLEALALTALGLIPVTLLMGLLWFLVSVTGERADKDVPDGLTAESAGLTVKSNQKPKQKRRRYE